MRVAVLSGEFFPFFRIFLNLIVHDLLGNTLIPRGLGGQVSSRDHFRVCSWCALVWGLLAASLLLCLGRRYSRERTGGVGVPVLRALQQEGRARGRCGCRSLEPGARGRSDSCCLRVFCVYMTTWDRRAEEMGVRRASAASSPSPRTPAVGAGPLFGAHACRGLT